MQDGVIVDGAAPIHGVHIITSVGARARRVHPGWCDAWNTKDTPLDLS